MFHVILAGGSGSRFWPKSRQNKPKQLLNILGDDTMICLTYKRLRKIAETDSILVVASHKLIKLIQKEIPEIPQKNYIIEPSGKNTAPAIGLAALHILNRDKNAIMGIFPADHMITGDEQFQSVITKARKMVEKESIMMTIGIKPTYPALGYGYIKYDTMNKSGIDGVNKIYSFTEKPEAATAKKYFHSNEFLWNTGMFIWKAAVVIQEMKTYMNKLYYSLEAISDVLLTSRYTKVLNKEWQLIQAESIDYGLLEKAKNVYTIEADFQWDDLGSWQALYNVLKKNKQQNYFDGDVISLQSENNLVISPNRLTALVGINDMAIINLKDATLIVPQEKSEMVKDIVEMLKSMNKSEYL